jgi:hypothetical protein
MAALGGGQVVRLGGAAIALLLLLLAGAPSAGAAPPPVPPSGPSVVEAKPLTLREIGPRTVVAQVDGGYCAGAPYRPSLERVALRWRGLGPRRFSAVLTAYVRTPVYSTSSRAGEGPITVHVCAGLAYELTAKVVLPQPLARIDFSDGSFSPPQRMQHRPPYWLAPNS